MTNQGVSQFEYWCSSTYKPKMSVVSQENFILNQSRIALFVNSKCSVSVGCTNIRNIAKLQSGKITAKKTAK
ncbi:MAG: hypothetical protein MET45_21105 [Nostoc sp. LLA-1]|nr:hypothetical protein [Cyanocohniella sp. LLY]